MVEAEKRDDDTVMITGDHPTRKSEEHRKVMGQTILYWID